jgi:hypothetical protein
VCSSDLTKKKLVILTSGNHGPEGYAGSALQAIFVEELMAKFDFSETGVLLVHALNPWGFKHHRRGTENNVNMNRNFDTTKGLFQTANPEYEKVRYLIELSGPVEDANSMPAKELLWEMVSKKEVTQQTLTEAIGKGQYHSPKGINYGGQDFEPQTLAVVALLKKIIPPYRSILHVDFHTGLGKRGVLHIMTQKELTDPSRDLQKKLFNQAGDFGHYELTPPNTKGFYPIFGDYADILGKLKPDPTRVHIGITAEIGTVGNGLIGKVRTINRLILENQGHYYGYKTPEIEATVKKNFLELFYPSDEGWRTKVIRDGRYFLGTVVPRFVKLAN